MKSRKNWYLRGTPIARTLIMGDIGAVALVDRHFQACNAGRRGEACQFLADRMLAPDVAIGMRLTGALTPAGLSGATPSEAVRWGEVDPESLPDAVVAYSDSTIAMPVMVSYALSRRRPRKLRRLYDRRVEPVESLRREYEGAPKKEHSHQKPKEGHR